MINCNQIKKEIDRLIKINSMFGSFYTLYSIEKQDFLNLYFFLQNHYSLKLKENEYSYYKQYEIQINYGSTDFYFHSENIENEEIEKFQMLINNKSLLLPQPKAKQLKSKQLILLNDNNSK